ncbi:MAG: hypothetical protein AB1793_06395 [Candidatus Thermoplasmatota archaeon]
MGMWKQAVVCALSLVAVMSVFAAPAAATDRSEGDYWVYEGEMEYEGIAVTGTFRYEFEEKDSLTVGSETYDVNVMKVTGSMTGETDDFLGISATVEMTFDGYSYDLVGGMAVVKEDMHMWANLTIGTGSLAIVTMVETQDVTTNSPPFMSGFVDGETGAGDQWNETVEVSTTSTTWIDGAMEDTYSGTYTEDHAFTVAAAEESVTVDAGTFSCLKITATGEWDDYIVYWYSPDVAGWVKMSSYSMGETSPYMTIELSEYTHGGLSATMVLMIVGAVAIIAVVIVVALLMLRRGRTPTQVPPPMPPPPPTG